MSEVIFESGDVVTCAFFGDKEFVLEEIENSEYPILINYVSSEGNRRYELFTREGLSHRYHSAPVLKLVRKKTKNRNAIGTFKVSSENESFFLENNEFSSYDDAFDWIKKNGIIGWVYSIDKFYKINYL